MTKATLNGTVLAESNDTIVIEGNHYFPPSSIQKNRFTDSQTHTTCGWKGEASYYNVSVGDETINDLAWYYPEPKKAAESIKDYVAFYKNKATIE